MATQKNDKAKNEGAPEIIAVILMTVVGLVGVVWLFASNKIVWNTLNPLLTLGSMWTWIPMQATYSVWNGLVASANTFAADPSAVGIFAWLGFVNSALLPTSVLLFLLYLPLAVWILVRKKVNVARKISPDMLLAHTLKTFSGISPVLKIRKKIVENKLKGWRLQVTPEEVFSGKVGNRSMIASGEFDREVAREYFIGAVGEGTPDGRLKSRMLGTQIVHLINDRGAKPPVVFTDRLSSEGKVLMAMWAAVAFGGEDGKKEYTQYCNMLNLSAYGSPTGMANLTLGQPLFEKYRKNKDVLKLFAVHHWEHTFLFSLLEIAQRRGRYTTAEILWLRPMNRIMFFSLNSCGSKVAHVEAASTFSQLGFERACANMQRIPLIPDRNKPGVYHHVISIERCVDGLEADYLHWRESSDDNRDWWSSDKLWKSRDAAIVRTLADSMKVELPPEPAGEASLFDKQETTARNEIEKTAETDVADELTRVFGDPTAN